MKSRGLDMGESDLSLPFLQPFSIQPGFWQAQSSRRNGCSASFCSLTESGGWEDSQEDFCGQQISLWLTRCETARGQMMCEVWRVNNAPTRDQSQSFCGTLKHWWEVGIQWRCSWYRLPAGGFVFQRWKYCPSQDPWLLQCQVLCTWTGGELCGLPRWPRCQRLQGQNSEGEQWYSSSCRCCCRGNLRGLVPQMFKRQQNCCEPCCVWLQEERWVSSHRHVSLKGCLLCQAYKKFGVLCNINCCFKLGSAKGSSCILLLFLYIHLML